MAKVSTIFDVDKDSRVCFRPAEHLFVALVIPPSWFLHNVWKGCISIGTFFAQRTQHLAVRT